MDELVIAGKKFKSRLITGTGKHRSSKDLHDSIVASETEMITVAIRRINFDDPKEKNLLDVIDWDKYNILPNTAGSKTAEEAIGVLRHTLELEEAGVVGVEFEVVPPKVAAIVTKKTKIITMSMGSGSDCDAQFLFSNDILGWTEGHMPRHARVYRNFKKEYERLQRESVAAFKEFHQDTLDKNFNDPKITVSIDDREYDKFLEMAEKI